MKKEETKENVSVETNQQIINTDAAKAKANELIEKAKKGINYYKENIKTDKKLQIGTGIVVLVLVLFLLLGLMNPSKSVAKKYAEAMLDYDAKAMVKLTHEDMIDYYDDMFDDYEEMLEEGFEELEDEDIEYKSYTIDGDYKKYDDKDLRKFAKQLDTIYDIDRDSVKEVRRYTIKFKIDNDGDKDTEKEKVLVAKIDGKWYFVGTE